MDLCVVEIFNHVFVYISSRDTHILQLGVGGGGGISIIVG